jgi:polyisoprenoid-binding protein YceI
MNKFFKMLLVTLLASGCMSLVAAEVVMEESDICSPFMDGKVDESLIANMLDAAESGYLYRVRRDTSQVGFCVSSGWSQVKGDFRKFSGGLALLPDNSATDGNEQAMLIIHTDSLDTRSGMVEGIIKGKSFFDVEQYPEILFVSHGFVWTGDNSAQIIGDLTVRDVTRQVIFDVTLTPIEQPGNGTVERMLVKARTTINRSDFGMHSMPGLVSDTVTLCMSVEAVRYAG